MKIRTLWDALIWFALAMLVLSGTGCSKMESSSVKQSEIYTSYSASYDDDSRMIQFESSFTAGGPTGTFLILDGTSQVTLDGSKMDEEQDILNRVIYRRFASNIGSTELQKTYAFSYLNNDGQTYQNTVKIPPAVSHDVTTNLSISISSDFTAHWTIPDSVGSSEQYNSYIEKKDQGGSASGYDHSPAGSSGIVSFKAADLAKIGTGAATFQLCRRVESTPAQAPAEGGSMTSQYCVKKVNVTLSP